MRRREAGAALPDPLPSLLEFPADVGAEDVQAESDGTGPLFHRTYSTHIRDSGTSPDQLMKAVKADLNQPAPTTFARFQRLGGEPGPIELGDEFVVRMPGPWDGPVRVIGVGTRSFRLATLTGHLEAGQIEFRAGATDNGELTFEIESWARSSSKIVNLLYHRLRMAKEVQAHMWISFLEGVVRLSGGRMSGGIELETERISERDDLLLGPPGVRRRLAKLPSKPLNFSLDALADARPGAGWTVTDLSQPLPGELPGEPVPGGSWDIARRLMRGYEFADPSIVRAYYDPGAPLQGRNMLLRLQALGLVRLFVGVRVGDVYEHTRQLGSRTAQIWGWNYRTLRGHVEMGQMAWEVWKWLDDGTVEFRVHSISRTARIRNPVVRLGFWALRGHERRVFLNSTKRRMRAFTELALADQRADRAVRQAGADMTARPTWMTGATEDVLARNLRDGPEPAPVSERQRRP